jgi:hypothetical protein
MGQTVSISTDGLEVFLSGFVSESDELAQVLLRDTGLGLEDVAPEPGWFGYSTAYGIVLRFRPHLVNTGIATYDNTLIARLARPAASAATAVLHHRDDAPWDGNQNATTPWVHTVLEAQPDDELTVSVPQFSLQATNVPRLFRAQAFNHGAEAPVWDAGPATVVAAEADGDVVGVSAAFEEGELDVTVTAQHNSQSYTASAVTTIVEPVLLDPPPQISLNPFDEVPLDAGHLEYPDQVTSMGGEPITHVAFLLPGALYLEHNGAKYNGYVVVAAEDVPDLRLRQQGFKMLRNFAQLSIQFWVSFDRGLSFVAFSIIAVTAFPCFDLNARICIGIRNGRRRWQLVKDLRPGQTVICEHNVPRVVRSVMLTPCMAAQVVRIKKHALSRNCPDRPLLITSNHRVKLRVGGGSIPAGRLPDLLRSTKVQRMYKPQIKLCHVELDQYAFPLVNNMFCESHIKRGKRPIRPRNTGNCITMKHKIEDFRRRPRKTTATSKIDGRSHRFIKLMRRRWGGIRRVEILGRKW